MTEKETRIVPFVCIGVAPLKGGALGTYFLELEDDCVTMKSASRAAYHGYKRIPTCRAGEVYFLKLDAENALHGVPEYKGILQDEDERLRIMAEDQAREIDRRAKAKKMADSYLTPLVMERLEPLRKAHDNLDYHGRLALEMAILEWLRRVRQ